MKRILGAVLLLVCTSAHAGSKTMYVTRDNTKLLSDKNSKAGVVQLMKAGDAVTIDDAGGNFLFKKATSQSGKSGFIPYTSLSDKNDANWKKVVNYVKGFTKPEENEVESAKARSANAIMGIRGLTSTDSEALGSVSNARPNLKAVYAMEEMMINERKLNIIVESVMAENEMIQNRNP